MCITGSYSRLYAIDVNTGEELWQYDARLPKGILPCCDVINRGAALESAQGTGSELIQPEHQRQRRAFGCAVFRSGRALHQ